MWVKLCGQTRAEDALKAAELEADAVGFILVAGGKRTRTPQEIAAITRALPVTMEKIGVFGVPDAAAIAREAAEAGLTGVQLHFPYDPEVVEALRTLLPAGSRIVQTVHWNLDLSTEEQAERFALDAQRVDAAGLVDNILIDSRTSNASGGTGKVFDWNAAAPIIAALQTPVIAAGGLTPDNVAEAILVMNPWGVDVSSGTESEPGIKDAQKMRAFVEAAKL